MCFVKSFTVTFLVDSPVEINNLVPPATHDFYNSVSLNALASKVATSAVIVGHSSKDLELFIDTTFRASISSFSAWRFSIFPHVARNVAGWERRSHTFFTFCFKMALKLF